jgi:drug/metabolite transporter (DMT)-like permease
MRVADWLMLTVLAAIWGASYLFIRVAAPAIGPFPLMAARVLIAGAVLAALAAALGRGPSLRDRWRSYLLLGLVNAAVPFTLIAAAELYVTASLAGIVTTTAPLFSALVAAAWLRDPLTARSVLGLLLGTLGVAVLVGWSPLPLGPELILSVAALLVAAFCYGLGAVYTRAAFRGVPLLGLATAQQLAAGAELLVPAVVTADAPWPQPPAVVLSVLALALLSTALAYLIYFRLIERVGPTRALMVSILVPFFGVLWGVVFLGEAVTPGTFAGLGIVLCGVALASGARPRLLPDRRPSPTRGSPAPGVD